MIERPQTCRACGRVIAIWRKDQKVQEFPHAPECIDPDIPTPQPYLTEEEESQRLIEWVKVSNDLKTKSDIELGRMIQQHIINEMPATEPRTLLLEELCNRMIERACPHSLKENHDDIVQCAGCGKIFENEAIQPAK